MRCLDWLVLFTGYVPPGAAEPPELSPVELQKGLFVLRHAVPLKDEEAYEFQAYDWGPVSAAIYDDIEELIATHLLRRTRPGSLTRRYYYYQATPIGQRVAAELAQTAGEDSLLCLEVIRSLLKELQFRQIVSAIYAAYPEYSVATTAPDLLPDGPGGARGELARLFTPAEIRWRADTLRGMREIERGQYVTRADLAGLLGRHGA